MKKVSCNIYISISLYYIYLYSFIYVYIYVKEYIYEIDICINVWWCIVILESGWEKNISKEKSYGMYSWIYTSYTNYISRISKKWPPCCGGQTNPWLILN